MKKPALFALFVVFISVSFSLVDVHGQNLQINTTIPKTGESRFSVCGGERKVKIRVENVTPTTTTLPTGTPLTAIVAELDFTTLSAQGLKFTGTLTTLAGGGVTVNSSVPNKPTFNLPDLINRGDFVEFEVGVQADCEAKALSLGTATPNFNIKLTYTGGTGTQNANTGTFEVVKPTLSIPSIIGNKITGVTKTGFQQNIYDGIKGKIDTITVNVVNAGDGPLSQYVYWVKDHPLLTLQKVLVGNIELPILGTSGDTTFFDVTPAAIAFAQSGVGSPTNNTALFQFNESMNFKEVWFTDDCSKTFPDIIRGVRYGCDGTPLGKCEQTSASSGLRFGFVRPILTATTSWHKLTTAEYNEGLPGCYSANNVKQRVYLINSGTGDAVNIKFNLAAYRAELDRAIVPNATVVRIGKYGPTQTYTVPKTYSQTLNGNCSTTGTRTYSADYQLTNTTLKPGDTLWVEFQMDYGCGCTKDGSYCSMDNYYFGVFAWGDRNWSAPSTYEDACGLQVYDINQVNTTDARSALGNSVEGPATVLGGQTNTNTYTVTDAQNTWLQSWKATFPRGIYHFKYKLGKGLDWCGTNGDLATTQFQWIDVNGKVWKPSRVQYADNDAAGDDFLEFDFRFADIPVGFVFGAGMQFKFNYKGDCTETGPVCSQGGTPTITQVIYFSPDENCTDCGLGQLVSCTNSINVVLKCPTCEPCEGLRPLSMKIERVSYDKADNDNNGRPDATGSIDKTKIRTDRFISGDTLLARYKGVFSASTHPNWTNAFSVINLPTGFPATLTPLGGKVQIRPAGGGVYDATILQQFPDGLQVVTDLSPAKLKSLGNTAIPAGYTAYQNGDTVCVDVKFTVSDPCFNVYTDADVIKELLLTDNSFASTKATWADAKNDRFACDVIRARGYLIKMKAYLSSSNGSYLGGCDLGNLGYDWTGFFIGSQTLDYFPFEYRAPKAMITKAKYYKDPTLNYARFRWHYYAKDYIGTPYPMGSVPVNSGKYGDLITGSATSGSYWGELPMDSPYLTIIGDTLCFAVDKFRQDNFPNFTADEGYRFAGVPYFQGTCLTPKSAGSSTIRWKPTYTFATNEAVFGYNQFTQGRYAICPTMVNPYSTWDLGYGYAGGPSLLLQTPIKEQQALGDVTCFEVQLTNLTDFKANLAWMSVSSPSGAVVIRSVRETTGGANIALSPTLGIYQLGAVNGGTAVSRVLEICVSSNNCVRDSIVVNVGWDCNVYPRTLEEATCGTKQSLYIKPIDYELGMIIKAPETPITADLCAETEYIVQLSSTKLGSLSDIMLDIEFPDGQEYIPGSMQYAYPLTSGDPAAATFKPASDPTLKYGSTYTLNVSKQDPILSSTGLPGTLQVGKNFLFVKFKTRTNCDYMSGSSVNFLSNALTACGEIANYRVSTASSLNINGIPEIYKTEIRLNAAKLNPCKNETTQIKVEFGILPNSVPTTSSDSLRIIMPPGLTYVAGSYNAGPNAKSSEPFIKTKNGQQYLCWDLNDNLAGGTTITFTFDALATDAGQECRSYPIIAQTFSSKGALCVTTGQTCTIRALSSETRQSITFDKPDISVLSFSASSEALPPSQEEITYSLTIQNTGASVPAGAQTNIQVYTDNGDGDYGVGDVLLFTATTTEAIPSGATLNISGSAIVNSGNTCNLIAVINPATTCACKLTRSFQIKPKLTLPFTKTIKVCSNTAQLVGPSSLSGVSYEWFGISGAPTTALSSTTSSPVTFKLQNTTANNLTLKYAVRIIRGGGQCYSFDTLTVSLFAEKRDSVTFSVCQNSSFNLAGPTSGSNYQWTPTTNLTNPTSPITTVTGGITAATRYVLNYTDANGCPAVFIAKANVLQCANTALGDTVWYDRNENGIQDNNEAGVGGITVYLYNATNTTTPIAQTITDSKGYYIFDNLPFGNYKIGFKLPTGATFTKTNIGDDTKDSDADPTTGITAAVFLPNGVQDFTIDAGLVFKDWGDAPNTYKTDATSVGPSHLWLSGLRLGDLWDANTQGIPATTGQVARGDDNNSLDDEDAIASFPTLNTMMVGQTYTLSVKVVDSLNLGPKLVSWIDFNGNGIFEEAEGVLVNVPVGTNGIVPVSFTLPATMKAGVTYARFRLSTASTLTTLTPSGALTDGEVEDYELTISNLYDWGDAPDSYTTDATGVAGPSHILIPNLKLGTIVDNETNGQPVAAGADALGDDNNGATDDEDGIAVFPTIYNSYKSYTLSVKVQNITGKDARLLGWIDWNGDGIFQISEAAEIAIPNGTDGDKDIIFTMPTATIAGKTYARFRLTYDPAVTKSTPGGAANSGEVEDYQFTILPCIMPDAGLPFIICLPTTSAKLADANATQAWSPVPTNPASATIDPATGLIQGMNVAGKYNFVLSYTPAGNTCTDTVTVTVNPKPNAGIDVQVCEPVTKAQLQGTAAGGLWSALSTNPAGVIDNNTGAVTQLTVNGTYYFVYTLNTCSDTVKITRFLKPDAGKDFTICNAQQNILLTGSPANGTWSVLSQPSGANVVINTDIASELTQPGTYSFVYDLSGCKDTIVVTSNPLPKFTVTGVNPTCNDQGLPNNDGKVSIVAATINNRYVFNTTGFGTLPTDVTGTTVLSTLPTILAQNILNNDPTKVYYVRVFNEFGCYKDTSITIRQEICNQRFGSIGNYVWRDQNGDGKQQATEIGVPNIKVCLLNDSGQKIDSTITNAQGKYSFTNLVSGTYKVQFIIPAAENLTKSNVAGAYPTDTLDSDPGANGITHPITIQVALNDNDTLRNNPNIDAGILPQYGSIGNYVWEDRNNDGVQDASEPPIMGVKVYLLNASGQKIDSTFTDVDGKYLFDSLVSGQYRVQFVPPLGTIVSPKDKDASDIVDSDIDNAGLTGLITLDVTKLKTDILRNNPNIDAGFVPVGSIGDYVWNDTNNDGLQQTNELPAANIKVYLLNDLGQIIDSTTTNEQGKYLFDSLLVGNYKVKFVAPLGTEFTSQNSGDDTQDSDANYTAGTTAVVSIDPTQPLGSPARDNRDVDAGLKVQYGSIGNYVWSDLDNDGKQGQTEPAIEGVKVCLYKVNTDGSLTKIDSMVTGADGKYLFDSLLNNTYRIQFIPPAGFTTSPESAPNTDLTNDSNIDQIGFTDNIVINVNTTPTDLLRNNSTIDAGFVPLGSIGDFVWADADKDGLQDSTEAGLKNIRVILYKKDASGIFVKIDSVLTDFNGKYLFDSLLVGDYQVQFVSPLGAEFTTTDVATNNADDADNDADYTTGFSTTISIDPSKTLGSPERDNSSIDAGLIVRYGSIGDYVWRDDNVDGKQDISEPPIAGVLVYLLNDKGQRIDSTMTDQDGKYMFDSLLSGVYRVQFMKPAGMMSTSSNATNVSDELDSDINLAGLSHPITIDVQKLVSDTLRNNPTIDAGFVRVGSIGDFVWLDKNGDGKQDANESGLTGIKVYLLDNNGNVIDSTTTDADGKYLFNDLLPNTYQVKFDKPLGSDFTPTDAIGNDGTDSDANTTTGLSPLITIDVTQPIGSTARDNRTIDAGLRTPFGSIGNYVWRDDNNNGKQDAAEIPIKNATVYLLSQTGQVLDSTLTDTNGRYLFDSLTSGKYIIRFAPPAGMIATWPNVVGSYPTDTLDSDASKAGYSHLISIDVTKSVSDTLRNNPHIDAGFTPVGSIGDYVWLDDNKDGQQGLTEKPAIGVKVYLYQETASGTYVIIDSTFTDSNGKYLFDSLLVGNYKVQFVAPTGTEFTQANAGVDGSDSDANFTTGLSDLIPIDPITKPIGDPGRDNRTTDAGLLTQYGSIGDYVWSDLNNDGQQDATEPAIQGVKVILYKLDSKGNFVQIDSTLTGINGKYLFDSLLSGQYQVKFIAPAQTLPAKQDVGTNDLDSDANTLGLTATITLDVTKLASDTLRNNPMIDAGFVPVGSIGNYVWRDQDGDGIQDTNEQGMAGIKVYLLDSNGIKIDSTLTDSTGKYQFNNVLSGQYRVQVILPPGAEFTASNKTTDALDSDFGTNGISQLITIDASKPVSDTLRNNPNIDAGILPQYGSIGNYVWRDDNRDGKQDATEPALAGVKVYLLNDKGQRIDSTLTNASGMYLFDSLIAGKYQVQFVPPAGTIVTKPNTTNDALDSDISNTGLSQMITIDVTKTQQDTLRNNPNIDAGFIPLGSIGDYVWADINKDGKQDAGEDGVEGIRVYLYQKNASDQYVIVDSTFTDVQGKYLFDSLVAGDYEIQFKAKSGTEFTQANATNDTQDSDANFLTGRTGTITLDTTKPLGDPARDNTSVDAGLIVQFGSIGNYVWIDSNNDGKQDATEKPIAGVEVVLWKVNSAGVLTKIESTITDVNGKYLFDSLLSGQYRVQFVSPANMIPAKTNTVIDTADSDAGNTGFTHLINLDVSKLPADTLRNNSQIDAGFVPVGSVGNFVWNDTNKDGIQTPDEQGVGGVKVYLYQQTASGTFVKIDSTFTNTDGKYLFDSLLAGQYEVQFVPIAGTEFTKQGEGTVGSVDSDADFTTGMTAPFTIDTSKPAGDPARDNRDIDAGLWMQFGSIGDYVWRDDNVDGKQDATEPPIAGVRVYLLNNLGIRIDSTLTNSLGKYLFDSLMSGQYQVQFMKSAGMMATLANVGKDSLDSDINKNGLTHLITLNVNMLSKDTLRNNPNIDAGFVRVGSIGNYVWLDSNADGIQDPTEKGVVGEKVYLLNDIGQIIDSTTTDSQGLYLFENLLPGTYQIKFDRPAGFTFSADKQGTDATKDSDADEATGLSAKITIDVTKPVGDPARDNRDIDAGVKTPFGSIGNYVWLDSNNDGKQDVTEAAIVGVKVYLYDTNNKILDSTYTNAQGKYLFDSLISGQYKVRFVAPAGTISSKANVGIDTLDSDAATNGFSHIITIDVTKLTADTLRNNPTIDAGFVPVGSIGDFVWLDTNKDGKQDPTETGVAGVKVYLLNANGVKIDSTLTDINGKYLFDSLLTGNYQIKFVPKAGTEFTLANAATDSLDSDANFATGLSPMISIDTSKPLGDPARDNRTVDAGLTTQYGSIGNYVWSDLNNDGKQDITESPIAGVKVYLHDLNYKIIDSTFTNSQGKYLFDSLMSSQYRVRFIAPLGTIASKSNVGIDSLDSDPDWTGITHFITINVMKPSADTLRNNMTIDAGFVPLGSLGNYVWDDANKDGKQDSTEIGMVGVKVYLLNANGIKIDSTTTDVNGKYLFKNLISGSYAVEFKAPTNYFASPASAAGVADSLNSDANTTTGRTRFVIIDASKALSDTARTNLNLDAGFYIDPNFGNTCVKPTAGPDQLVCKGVTTVKLPNAGTNQKWITWSGNLATSQIDSTSGNVTGMLKDGVYGYVLYNKKFGTACSDTVYVLRGMASVSVPKFQTSCSDSLMLMAGSWESLATNPAPVAISAAGKITGMTKINQTYQFLFKDVTTGCIIDTLSVRRIECRNLVDLHLTKTISKQSVVVGDTLTYTIKVWNEGINSKATSIVVSDSLNAGVQYISSLATSGSYSQLSKSWTIDSLKSGDTVRLSIKVKVLKAGVWFNTAEIQKMSEKDIDSTPGNGVNSEDDIDNACFSVPLEICKGTMTRFTLPTRFTNVIWYKDEKAIKQGNVLDFYEAGTYTFESSAGCPKSGCCPLIVTTIECCPANECVPLTVKRKPKKK